MKQLLLIFFIAITITTRVSSQELCDYPLACLETVTSLLGPNVTIWAKDLGGAEICENDSSFLEFNFHSPDSSFIVPFEKYHNIDCGVAPGTYNFHVILYELKLDGSLTTTSCFGELIFADLNNVCEGVGSKNSLNVIVDCGEDAIGVNGDEMEVNANENVCVPFRGKDFSNTVAVQSAIQWNEKVLRYTNLEEGVLKNITANESTSSEGEIKFVWIHEIGQAIPDFQDNDILFSLCFDAIGKEDEYSKVSMVGTDDIAIEFTKQGGEPFVSNYCLSPGLVNIAGDGQSASDYTATLNGEELPINDFNILSIPDELIVEGVNTIEFKNTAFETYLKDVSTLDIVMGLRMFLLDEPIDPLQAIALDVDYSGGINVKDLVLLRQLILGLIQTLPHPGYFFIEDNQEFDDPFDEFEYGYFDEYSFDSDSYKGGELLFRAYQYGDLSKFRNFRDDEIDVRASDAKLSYEDKMINLGETVNVKFELSNEGEYDISGFQTSLDLSGLEVLEFNHEYQGSTLLHYKPNDTALNILFATVSSEESVEFELVLRSKDKGMLSEKIGINQNYETELIYENLSNAKIQLEATKTDTEFTISPNPFIDITSVQIPEEYVGGNLTIYNLVGSRIYSKTGISSSHSIKAVDLMHKGVYIITLANQNRSTSKRVIFH